tara:strand:- start:219 stop:467 length:249 start_codon:yes stop_codon:yes gene_type:complete
MDDIAAIGKRMRERYTELNRNRSRTILLTNQEFNHLEYNPTSRLEPKVTKNDVKCRAIKMDGNICNAKVKDGEFCKRHSKSI